MTHVTSVGLDVHARPVSAAAFNLYTGEVTEARFGPEAGPIAERVLSFESPRAVYESGPTGFALCRKLRAPGVDCVVGAVSKMQRPAADKRVKNDRRDAAFLARLLAANNVVAVPVKCIVSSDTLAGGKIEAPPQRREPRWQSTTGTARPAPSSTAGTRRTSSWPAARPSSSARRSWASTRRRWAAGSPTESESWGSRARRG